MEEYYEEEEVQESLPFDDDFFEAVDNSIYCCVNEVVGPMEQRLSDVLFRIAPNWHAHIWFLRRHFLWPLMRVLRLPRRFV